MTKQFEELDDAFNVTSEIVSTETTEVAKEETEEVDTDAIEEVLEKVEATSDQVVNNNGESVESESSLRDRFAKTFKDSVKFCPV